MQISPINNNNYNQSFGSKIAKTREMKYVTKFMAWDIDPNIFNPESRNFLGALKAIINDGKDDTIMFHWKNHGSHVWVRKNNIPVKEYKMSDWGYCHEKYNFAAAVVEYAKEEKGFKPVTWSALDKDLFCGLDKNIVDDVKKVVTPEPENYVKYRRKTLSEIHKRVSSELKELCKGFGKD